MPDILQLLENKEQSNLQSDYYTEPNSDLFDSLLTKHTVLKEYIDLYVSSFSV